MAIDVHLEDIVKPAEAAEARSEVSVVLPPIKPNVVLTTAEPSSIVPTTTELPSSLPIAPSTDAAGGATIEFRVEIVSLCKR